MKLYSMPCSARSKWVVLFRGAVVLTLYLALLPLCHTATSVSVDDRDLDLASQIEDFRPHTGLPPVDLGPRLVVGQGGSSSNHTLIRVLNHYGIAELQFLAYPSSVRGGVYVAAGRLFEISLCWLNASRLRVSNLIATAWVPHTAGP